MNLNWELLIDAVMSEDDWQFSAPTDASLLRIEQTNAPTLGRFALGQASVTQLEFFDIKAYPARTESTRITLDEVGEEIRRIAIRYRYGQFPEGTPNTWRVKVYGAKLDLQPAINPSAIVLTFDPRVVGAIPLEEKGIPLGVATLDEDGLVSDDQLPTTGLAELVAANMEALDNLADQFEAITIPPAPTLAELGGEPSGAELRSRIYTDEQTSVPTSASLVLDNSLNPIALAGVLIGAIWTTPTNFTATSLAVWVTQQGLGPLKLALYEKTNNNLLTRIAQSVERTSVPVGTQTFELTNKIPVSTGKIYYICFYAPYGNNYKFGVEATITNGQLFDGNSFNYANGFPDTISGLYFQTNNKIAATAIGNESLKSAFLTLRENPPQPSIEPLIDEIEAEIASAIALHKQESEPHGQYVLEYELLAHIQATNPHLVTLQQLGGEPSGSESRSKTYTDAKIQAVNDWITKLEKLYPAHLVHFWGYGRSFNGASLKNFEYQTQTGYDYYRWASVASPALGDTVEIDSVLRPGSYRLRIIYDKASDRGIVNFYINGVLLGSIDCYASAKVNVNRIDFTFETTTVRNNVIRAIIIGKNAASSGFRFGCTALFVYPNISTPPYQLINSGDFTPYFGSDGRQWQTDKNFSGGNSFDLEANVGAFTVSNTSDQRLYKFERSIENGTFTYTIPVTSGLYCLKLHFAENYHSGAGLRVGSVSVNGTVVLSSFDIFVQAGGKHRALIKQFDNINITTNLIITFTNTLINAIEIIRL